jgi:DNA mismatch repair protein MutS
MSLSSANLDLDRLTPMMAQYLEQKQQCPGCLLFFRLGDFYELFFEDAVTASRELELTLTGRDCGQAERAPMCGVPYHAVDAYIHRLIGRGYKVAICDQVEDPALAKGIVKRSIIRLITPGTVTDDAMLDQRRNNYLLSVYKLSRAYGLAACDLTTGSFEATSLIIGAAADKLLGEIVRYDPSEILVNQAFLDDPLARSIGEKYRFVLTQRPDEDFSLAQVDRLLPQLPGQQPLWTQAAAALLIYVQETQRIQPSHIKPVQVYTVDTYMALDPIARRNLEISATLRDGTRRGSLLWAIDRTVTALGGRLLRRWLDQPLLSVPDIRRRQAALAELKASFMRRQELRDGLAGLYDLERLSGKVALGTANARDLVALRQTLAKLPDLRGFLVGVSDAWLCELREHIDPQEALCDLLTRAIADEPAVTFKDGNLIKAGFNAEIDQLRLAATDGRQWILDLEAGERDQTGIKSLKVGFNRVFGYYIEVTRANLAQVPSHYVRKQTLANGERYITEALKAMEDTLLGAEQKLIALEYEVFGQIRDQVAAQIVRLQETAAALAHLDCLAALAELADREGYCCPEVDLSDQIEIRQGRHPVVEKMLGPGSFVPNDLAMDMDQARLMILTGPNMAGKSTYMRQIALIVLLAQTGSFVPAASARIGLVDRIFTRVGASDDLASGQSTFMVEMSEVAAILRHATARSLLILDEIGRGTSTYDGLSIAWSVIEYIVDRDNLGCRTLFATHYHELIDLAKKMPGVYNCHVAVREEGETVVFLHHIRPGGSDDSYGIEVARLAGVPDAVVQRAQELLLHLETENVERQKNKIRRNVRPMDGQIDLFSTSQTMKQADGILERLGALEVEHLTPLDALNILHELHLSAKRTGRKPT